MMRTLWYGWMGAVRLEVTCTHGTDDTAGHLVFRQDLLDVLDPIDALERVADCLAMVARLATEGMIELTDDCLFQ